MDRENHSGEEPVHPGVAPKLTQWVNEPSAAKLQQDLEASRQSHDEHCRQVDKWNELSEVKGKAQPPKVKGRSSVQPKLIRRQAEWRYSALTEPFNSSEKLYEISPATFEDGHAARQNDLVINNQFRTKINRVTFIDHYVRANVDEGSAIVRLGWNRITKDVEEEVPVWEYLEPSDPAQVQELEAAALLKQTDPRQYAETVPQEIQKALEYFEETGQPAIARQIGTEKITVEKVIDNRPALEVMNPHNVYFDPSCGIDIEKAGFVIVSFETSKAELMKLPKRYKNLKHVNWEGATTVADPYHSPNSKDSNFNYADALRKRVVAYEYWGNWDIHGTGELVPIVATWIGGVCVRMEENPFPDGKPPFVVVNYMPIKRALLGEPDAELLEDNQKILGAVTRGMIDLLGRSANGQQGFAKGMLDTLNRRRFEDGRDYEFNPNLTPQQGHITHTYPEFPQSAMAMLQMQNFEAEALTGVKAFSGGLSGESFGDVAAGIRGALDAASKREMEILRRLADGLVKIGKKIIAMNQVFLSEEEVVRITNTEFVTVKREELSTAAELDLKVDISTAEIDNSKAQDLSFMLQTIGPNAGFEIVKMILMEIARLKRMPELRHQIQQWEPKPDPLQQKLQELEVQLKMKELEKVQSEIDLNLARAQKEMAVADATDLDTVEQETGTTHARAKEMAGVQASANQSLEITKAIVKPKKTKEGGEKDPDIEAAVGWNELSRKLNDPRRDNNSGNNPPVNPQIPMVNTDPGVNPELIQ